VTVNLGSVVALLVFLGICFAAAAIGTVPTLESLRTWYPTLRKPAWTPPNWLFGPVWTVLYLLMAFAGWLAWRDSGVSVWIAIFLVQLALNAAWTLIFFGRRRLGLAAVEIASLWLAVLATTVGFWTVNRYAGLLLVPYLLWVTFAGFLNIAIWRLNQSAA
jgi:translocator protein